MIKIDHLVTPDIVTMKAIINGMRNPMNSWAKSDTTETIIGSDDYDLMLRLARAGSEHRKYARMMQVIVNITAPLYWWKEFDTYKIGTVANSCSTMHKIASKEFTMEDFSTEHLTDYSRQMMQYTVNTLNIFRGRYNANKKKEDWWQMIQLLPSSYNQMRTVCLNYEVLQNIYHQRKDHKLDEWRAFCEWMRMNLPMIEIITGGEEHG